MLSLSFARDLATRKVDGGTFISRWGCWVVKSLENTRYLCCIKVVLSLEISAFDDVRDWHFFNLTRLIGLTLPVVAIEVCLTFDKLGDQTVSRLFL